MVRVNADGSKTTGIFLNPAPKQEQDFPAKEKAAEKPEAKKAKKK